jgi:nitrite reductase (NO-forming)
MALTTQRDEVRAMTIEPRPDNTAARDGWVLYMAAVAMVCVLGTIVAVGIALRDEEASSASASGTVEMAVELGDLYVEPSMIEVAPGQLLVLEVTNAGAVPHDLKLDGTEGTEMLDPGTTERITLGPFDESAAAWCTVPGHREAGMELQIVVTGDAPVAGVDSADGAIIDFAAEPEADWQPFDPALRPAPGGIEHEITMRADEVVLEVAPGVTQEMWVFDEQVPGPILRGKVGDLFTVTLVNDGEIPHSIDFHASKVAWNDEMRSIEPGEELVYQFEAKHAGAYMYHCGTAPALHHIGNGMFGAIIIDPPDLPPVDHEFVFVQSEIYTGPEGGPGDLTKMIDDAWDAVVFNGYVNQYLHRPVRVEPGERVRAWVVDAGPSENSSFHIVGTVFDTVFKEGAYLLRSGPERGGAQALDLQPAQGGFVEFTFDEVGLYPIVTHKFSNVGKGALGLFQAGEVEPAEGGH